MKKTNQMKRSAIAMLLAFCLSFSMLGTAFATDGDTTAAADSVELQASAVNYVVLGDSVSNGYGLSGYSYDANGFQKKVTDSWPVKVANNLKSVGWTLDAQHQLATTGMSASDLELMLTGSSAQATAFQSKVAEADVITLAAGGADFVSLLPNCLFAKIGLLAGEDAPNVDVNGAMAKLSGDAAALKVVEDVSSTMKTALASYVDSSKIALADEAVRYVTASMLAGYKGSLDAIIELNPDADVIVCGIVNGYSGVKIEATNKATGSVETLDMGKMVAPAINAINGYFASYAQGKDGHGVAFDAYIAQTGSPNLSVLVDDIFSKCKSDEVIRGLVIDSVSDIVFGMMGDEALMSGVPPLTDITLADVRTYESKWSAGASAFGTWAKQNRSVAFSVAVYLGVEETLVNETARLAKIDGDALAELTKSGGMSAYKEKIKSQVSNKISSAMGKIFANWSYFSAAGSDTFAAAVVAGPELIHAVMADDEAMPSILYLFTRMVVGDGMGSHPDKEGNEIIASAVMSVATSVTPGDNSEADHTYGDWKTKTDKTCTVDGEKVAECTFDGCNAKKTEKIPAGHTFGDWVTTDPVCKVGEEKDGKKVRTCSGCGETETETIPYAHTPVIDKAVAPTETTDGLTEGSHCDACGYVIKAQEVIPAGTTGGDTGGNGGTGGEGGGSGEGTGGGGGAIGGGGGGGGLGGSVDISSLQYSGISSKLSYDGTPIEIKPIITDAAAGVTLVQDTDFTVQITDAKGAKVSKIEAVGTYTVTIAGAGSYSGEVSFSIEVTEAPAVELEGMFKDVDADAAKKGGYDKLWYAEWLEYVVANDIMGGYTSGPDKGNFGVRDSITRGQVAVILYRAECANNPVLEASYGSTTDSAKFAKSSRFTDAKGGKYYTAALNWAKEAGIMTGDGSTNYTTVRPEDPISRQELCIMLARFANGGHVPETALDAEMSENILGMDEVAGWAEDGVNWSVNNGVISGADNHDGTTSMNPGDNTERAAAAKMLTVTLRDVLG